MIKVKYNSQTTLVEGYFPDNINYPNNDIDTVNKTIDGEPYIEIEANQQVFDKQMCVVNNEYQEFVPTPEVQLQEAKDAQIAQMKINRDDNIAKDYVLSEGNEITTTVVEPIQSDWVIGDIYTFYFNVKETGLSATEPSTILTNATNTDFVPYSCGIITGVDPDTGKDIIKKGYIRITAAISDAIGNDLKNRTVFSVIRANTLEIQINACTTVAQVEAIDINFDDIN
jgi:hypothetical protein